MTEAGRFLQAGLEAMGFAEDDAAERILAIEAEARAPFVDTLQELIDAWTAIRPAVTVTGSGHEIHQRFVDALTLARAVLAQVRSNQ